MRILLSCVPYDHGKSGISVYMRSLVAALKRQGHQLTLVVEPGAERDFDVGSYIRVPRCCCPAILSMVWHLLVLPWFISRKKFDCVIIAAANRRAIGWSRGVFSIGVVHDLSQYHIEAKYDWLRMLYIKRVLPFFVRRLALVVAISESTRRDLFAYWQVPPPKTVCIYNGLSLSAPIAEAEVPDTPPEWGEGNYILYVARLEHPGKNHCNLIRAYSMLPAQLRQQYALVLAGAPWPGSEVIYQAAGAASSRIFFPGFVSAAVLTKLYRGASLYVFPSFFEGFGLPLLEAMHYGIPCACSNNSSLGELGGGGAALLFDPADPAAIAAALERGLTDSGLREQLVRAGHERVKLFDWDDHAARMMAEAEARRSGK